MENNHLVPAKTQVLDTVKNLLLVVKKIADDDDNALAAQLHRQIVQGPGNVGLLRALERRKTVHDLVDGTLTVTARRVIAHFLIKNPERHGVTLLQDKVGQAGGHHLGVLQLGVFPGAVLHGFAAIEQDVGDVVGFLLILLDEVAIGAAENLPVQVAGIVTGRIFAVLGKLNGEAAIGRLVLTGHVALHHVAGVKAQCLGAGDRLGVEQFLYLLLVHGARQSGGGLVHDQLSGASLGTASRIRSIISSAVTPSDCAEKLGMMRCRNTGCATEATSSQLTYT